MKEFFYTGLMGSGKSEKLIELISHDKVKHIVLNAVFDGKTGNKSVVSSRNGKSVNSIEVLAESDITAIRDLLYDLIIRENVQVIYIDEIQFLDPIQVDFIHQYIKYFKVTIVYFGLETDFTGALFKATKYLKDVLNDESIHCIKRKCEMCDSEAVYNARIVNGKVVHSGDLFAEEKALYRALCKFHYSS